MSKGSRRYKDFFKCPELSHMYERGRMDLFFEKYKSLVNPGTFLAAGGDATVFHYSDDSVLKIAPKTLRFFKHFGTQRSGKEFMKCINKLSPFFLPVEEILYDDDNFFVYRQKKCQMIESKNIDAKIVIDLFKLIQFMLVNEILLTDLAPHNLGIIKGHAIVFDYHGLHRFAVGGKIKRPFWWHRLSRNLTRFICSLYCPKKRSFYADLMQDCNGDVIKQMSSDGDLPKCFVAMIDYFMKNNERVKIPEVCQHLENVIKHIQHTHH